MHDHVFAGVSLAAYMGITVRLRIAFRATGLSKSVFVDDVAFLNELTDADSDGLFGLIDEFST